MDYDETLGAQYERAQENRENTVPLLKQSQFDSLIEKCENAVIDMHRPIVHSESAQRARIRRCLLDEYPEIHGTLSHQTYDFITFSEREKEPEIIMGKITSYNTNTFKGRVYTIEVGHPLPFELSESARSEEDVEVIVNSLLLSSRKENHATSVGAIPLKVLKNITRNGRLKGFYVIEVDPELEAEGLE